MSRSPFTGIANSNYKCLPNYYAYLIQCNILKFVTIFATFWINFFCFVRMTFFRRKLFLNQTKTFKSNRFAYEGIQLFHGR